MHAARESIARILGSGGPAAPCWQLLFAISGCVLCLAGLTAIGIDFATHDGYPSETDLDIYLRAASSLSTNPYDPAINPGFDRYGYPPLLLGVIAALSIVFNGDVLHWIWPVGCLAAMVATVILLCRGFGVRLPWAVILFVIGLLLVGRVVRSDLVQGQVNVFVLLCLTLGCWHRARGQVIRAAFAFAIMMSLKPFMGAVAIYFLLRRDWRMASWTLGLGAAVFFVSFLPSGFNALDTWNGWRQATDYFTSAPFVTKPDNQSAYGFALRAFTDTPYATPLVDNGKLVPVFMAAIVSLAGSLAIVGLHKERRDDMRPLGPAPATLLLECAMIVALVMACGPLTQGNHMLIMLGGLAATLIVGVGRICAGSPVARWWIAAIATWGVIAFFVVYPKIIPFTYGLYPHWFGLDGAEVLLSWRNGLLLMLAGGLTAVTLWQERRAVAPAPSPARIALALRTGHKG
jgi:hypothetical protein